MLAFFSFFLAGWVFVKEGRKEGRGKGRTGFFHVLDGGGGVSGAYERGGGIRLWNSSAWGALYNNIIL